MNSIIAEVRCGHQSIHPSVTSIHKRVIDIIGALIGLAFTGLILFIVALLMFLFDPGPILYSQIRCGLYGQTFRIWKIRSMVVNADQLKSQIPNESLGQVFKNENDPRITSLGKLLRKASIDEFPQFWNVLKGEMSLVGTRPPTIDEVQSYKIHHWERLKVKPGITGEWQVNGRSKIRNFEDIVKLDIRYQQKWSIVHDMKLICKTIPMVLARKGAC